MKGIRLAAFVLVMLLAVGSGIAFAEEEPDEPSEADAAALSAPPQPSAGVELPAKRTATSQTFRLSPDQLETRIYADPINYRDAEGEWRPIKEGFEELPGGGLANGDNGFDLSLPKHLGEAPIRLSDEGQWVSSELLGVEPDPVRLEGETASYQSSDGNATFEFSTLANGVKENVELADPTAPSSFSFRLDASKGLTPDLRDDGSIAFRDGEGTVEAILPAPSVEDASPGSTTTSAAHYSLEPLGEGWRLEVSIDRGWLDQPERSWPVTLDPTLTLKTISLDCTYGGKSGETGWKACGSSGQKELLTYVHQVGPEAQSEYARSLIRFDLSAIPSNAYMTNGTVGLYAPEEVKSTKLSRTGLILAKAIKLWTSNVNWLTYDGTNLWKKQGGDWEVPNYEITTNERGPQAGWWNFEEPVLGEQVEKWVQGKNLYYGFLLKLRSDGLGECKYKCDEQTIDLASSAYPEVDKRPYVSLAYYTPAPTGSKVVSPSEGTVSSRRLKLKAHWTEPGVTGVTFQYENPNSTKRFYTIPAQDVRNAKGEEPKWPMPVSGFDSEPLYLDTSMVANLYKYDGGKIEIRALFEGPTGIAGYSKANEATINREIGGPKDATAAIGPGSVNLQTGNFTVSRTDVSVPGVTTGLEFSRSHSSRAPGVVEDKTVLGRGWKPSVPVEEAGGSEWQSVREVNPTAEEVEEGLEAYVLVTDLEGYEMAFEKQGASYVTPPEATGWVLSHPSGTTFTLSDPSGSVTTFDNGGSGTTYLPSAISIPGSSSNQSTVVYNFVNGVRRLDSIIAPAVPGITCTHEVLSQLGCHALSFSYAPASKWGAPASYGDRLERITYWSPKSGSEPGNRDVAQYEYDSSGRLIAEWNPSISPALKETYTYVGTGKETPKGGQLKTITPPGQEPWTLEYAASEFDRLYVGRLKSVKRPSLLAEPTVAQTTIAYEVPLSGGSAPYDMSGSSVAKWGQQAIPTDATAIFPPDEVPAEPPSSYARATVYYMDVEGQEVNVATPPGAGTEAPSITTSETDEYGNVVRELTAQNRLRALSAGSEAEMIAKSHELETKREYSAEGTQLSQEWGPLHEVRLENGESVRAQLHTTIQYNEGWPGMGVNPHLPTRVTTGAKVPGKGIDADQRVTETKYDWSLRKPIETIVDPGGLALRTKATYDSATGLQLSATLPGGSGEDAHKTLFDYYYTESWNPSGLGSTCKTGAEKKVGFAGLLCRTRPAGQPGTPGLPELGVTKYKSYSPYLQSTEVTESPGGKEETTRKTVSAFDAAGRLLSKAVTGGGTELPATATVYDEKTGLPVEQKYVCEGCDTQAVVTAFDKLGRPVQYTDADGNTSKATYDLDSRPATIYDGKGTQTFGYDSTSGLLTKLEDSSVGTFTASYNADGVMTDEGLPDGLVATTTYDEVGEPTALSYVKATSCSEKCTWLEEGEESSIYGQVLTRSTLSSSQQYSYDKAGRLSLAKDTQEGKCTTRSYTFDADSNRTSLRTRAPGINGECKTESTGTLQEYSYDAADRLTGEGITYDNFGRITSLPGKYAGGSTLTTSFYSNEMIASQSQAGLTNSYQLDATGRVRQVTQSGTKEGTEVFHYAMASDSTAWTERGSAWTRDVASIGGSLTAIQPSEGEASLQLTDLHGDVVATASLSASAKEPTAKFEFDEFGNPEKGTAGRYGWLGGKRRRAELPSGVVQMGVRSYIPTLGRFISRDPIPGGSANAYDYAYQDPINNFDLTGECGHRGDMHNCSERRRAVHNANENKRQILPVPLRRGYNSHLGHILKEATHFEKNMNEAAKKPYTASQVRSLEKKIDWGSASSIPCKTIGLALAGGGIATGSAGIATVWIPGVGETLLLVSGGLDLGGVAADLSHEKGLC